MANPLDILRMLGRKPTGPEAMAPPPAPDMPDAFKRALPPYTTDKPGSGFADFNPPNIPDFGGADTVVNDDPNAGIRMQLAGIDPKTTPSVLAGLKAAGGDPEQHLFAIQDKLRDEYEQNLSKGTMQAGAGGNPYGVSRGTTPADLLQANRDITESLPEQYKQQRLDEAQRQYEARMGGFGSPQQAEAFKRFLEQGKVTAPIETEKIRAQGNLDVQNAANQGFLDQLKQMGPLQPGETVQGQRGMRVSQAPVTPGAATVGEKSLEQLQAELDRYQNPTWHDLTVRATPEAERLQHIDDLKGRIAAIQGRIGGRPQTPSSSMRFVAPGTKDRINGIPATWNGRQWIED